MRKTLNLFLSCLFCSYKTDNFKTPINILLTPFVVTSQSQGYCVSTCLCIAVKYSSIGMYISALV